MLGNPAQFIFSIEFLVGCLEDESHDRCLAILLAAQQRQSRETMTSVSARHILSTPFPNAISLLDIQVSYFTHSSSLPRLSSYFIFGIFLKQLLMIVLSMFLVPVDDFSI